MSSEQGSVMAHNAEAKGAGAADLDGLRGAARVVAAVAAVRAGELAKAEALVAIGEEDVEAVLHTQFEGGGVQLLASGLGASPGAAVGKVFFDADAACDAYDEGDDVVLAMQETSPEDVHGMEIAEGILTSRGGLASHAAVVARGWGKPAVCGVEAIVFGDREFRVGDNVVREGDLISLDGASGEVFLGAAAQTDDEECPELDELLAWADEVRSGSLGVRANADTADDAMVARSFGAEGIGLCRTEHQFLGERLPAVRSMILAETPAEETAALAALEELQEQDFESLLEAMDGLPVTVRLLDPPLHEFLPSMEELIVEEATETLTDERTALIECARRWHEQNPMLGTRGVRLGILKDGLYHMQVRALIRAAAARRKAGGDPQVEIMVPLVVDERELALVRGWVDDEIAALGADPDTVLVGTMVETPRAALCADSIAATADFLSFGTNDLTQMVFGFSRDDVEVRVIGEYLARGLLDANPFQTLDPDGVGALVASATSAAQAAKPSIKVGVCGEHGGDPASIVQFYAAGLDYVSCSPYRVPVARLAAAQAVLNAAT